MAARDSHFVCQECGHSALTWTGRCPGCGEWNTLVEAKRPGAGGGRRSGSAKPAGAAVQRPVPLREVQAPKEDRLLTGIAELDRVLGGGLVPGSVVLVGGEPGIGKSTLLLQAAAGVAAGVGSDRVLYATGEESGAQVRLRAERLGPLRGEAGGDSAAAAGVAAGVGSDRVLYATGEESGAQVRLRAERLGLLGGEAGGIHVVAESSIDRIAEIAMGSPIPALVVVDSIQTATVDELDGP